MEERTLLFKPKAHGFFKRSPLYVVPMFGKTLGACISYLWQGLHGRVDKALTDRYIDQFWRQHFQDSFTSLYVTGRELLNPNETYVFMSNHESWMDIPAMFGAVPSSLRMVSKAGLMKIPIIGHAMANAGFIAIDRRNRRRAIRQLDEAKERLAEGISVWIAPEGTRTRDGIIGPFKRGGFYLAKQLKKSIVPVFIEGAAQVMPADGIMVNANQCITVHFCKPISASTFDGMDTVETVDMVRAAIIAKQKESLSIAKGAQ